MLKWVGKIRPCRKSFTRSSKNYGELGKVLIDLLENYTEVYYFTTEATEAVVETARSLLNTNQQERITIFAVLTD
jgi:hypothetical protein